MSYLAQRRARVLELYAQGAPLRDIVRITGCSRSVLDKTINRAVVLGEVEDLDPIDCIGADVIDWRAVARACDAHLEDLRREHGKGAVGPHPELVEGRQSAVGPDPGPLPVAGEGAAAHGRGERPHPGPLPLAGEGAAARRGGRSPLATRQSQSAPTAALRRAQDAGLPPTAS